MKLSKKDFFKKVRDIRAKMPATHNGRKVYVYGEDSFWGKHILACASKWEGYRLEQVYIKPSEAKKRAYEEVLDMYYASEGHESFGICSHNTQGFTVSWLCKDGLVYLTAWSEYLIVFNE